MTPDVVIQFALIASATFLSGGIYRFGVQRGLRPELAVPVAITIALGGFTAAYLGLRAALFIP